jgi:phospholipid/cholesterol/gamma-HCH transport system substrate-binding protein
MRGFRRRQRVTAESHWAYSGPQSTRRFPQLPQRPPRPARRRPPRPGATSRFSDLQQRLRQVPRRARVAAAGVLAAALVLGLVLAVVGGGSPSLTLTARFATAPGLYVGNQVRILGMPVGTVTQVEPGPSYVTVVMVLTSVTDVPASARALLMAPQVVNDRYVELSPAYDGGPKMADGTVIPLARTATAISVDDIIKSLDDFAKALGPNGTNAKGALSSFVSSAAEAFGQHGAALHATLTSLGQALGALSSDSPQLTALFDNLGSLSQVASHYTSTYQAFANDLAVVSTELASDDSDIAGALANLQRALGALADFVRTNGSALGASVANLDTFASAVATKQQQLAAVFGVLPTALDNLTQAYDPNAPGGPALRARLDPVTGSAAFAKSVCGNPLLRLLLLSVDQSNDKDPNVDLACGVNGLLAALPTPPGASSGPNLSLSALLGGQQ